MVWRAARGLVGRGRMGKVGALCELCVVGCEGREESVNAVAAGGFCVERSARVGALARLSGWVGLGGLMGLDSVGFRCDVGGETRPLLSLSAGSSVVEDSKRSRSRRSANPRATLSGRMLEGRKALLVALPRLDIDLPAVRETVFCAGGGLLVMLLVAMRGAEWLWRRAWYIGEVVDVLATVVASTLSE